MLFNILLIIYDCCLLIRRVIRFRERILRGCCRAANSFISPWLPYLRFSVKVSHTNTVADDTPETDADPLSDACHLHDDEHHEHQKRFLPKINQYCARSPLNSTLTPPPLLFFSTSTIYFFLYFKPRKTPRRSQRHTPRNTPAPLTSEGLPPI